jgi:hypothetical protein
MVAILVRDLARQRLIFTTKIYKFIYLSSLNSTSAEKWYGQVRELALPVESVDSSHHKMFTDARTGPL